MLLKNVYKAKIKNIEHKIPDTTNAASIAVVMLK